MTGFQKQTFQRYAPAQAGDFASANARWNVLAGPGALVAAAAGVVIGRFAWAASLGSTDIETGETDFYQTVSNGGVGLPTGFVHRETNALITTFLAEAGYTILGGNPVTLFSGGDFWAKNDGASATAAGQKCYAAYADGRITTAATGTPPSNAGITANTASTNQLTVTANTGAPIAVGQPISGAGIPTGTYILALGTGTGGAGTYTMSAAATATATGVTVTALTAIETKWLAMSAAAAGELFKISSHALG